MVALKVGVVGCGYVADMYGRCLVNAAPEVELVGAVDSDSGRAASFVDHYGGQVRSCVSALLTDPEVDVILNLTHPKAHADITALALDHGKHVFSEKPLALDLDRGRELVETAMRLELALGVAPAVHRSPAARVLRRLLRGGHIGRLSHLYCDLDDGPVHRMGAESWFSERGLPWPMDDEFRAGPVIHHAPYALTWAVMLAGRVRSVKGFTTVAVEIKHDIPSGSDLCLAVLEHESGCLTRLTIGALANRRRELVAVAEDGQVQLADMWAVDGPVSIDGRQLLVPEATWPYLGTHRLNFQDGLRDLARCLRWDRRAGAYRFTVGYGLLGLHVLEMTLLFARCGPCDAVLTTSVVDMPPKQ